MKTRTDCNPSITKTNPFAKIKTRNILLWFILSIPLTLISIVLVSLIGSFIAYLGKLDPQSLALDDPLITLVIQYVWLYGSIIIWLWHQSRRSRLQFKFILGKLPRGHLWWRQLLIVVPIFLFSLGSGQLFYYLVSLLKPELVNTLISQQILVSSKQTVYPVLYNSLQVIFVVIVAPLIEEILFRGVILQRWIAKWGLASGLVISSLIFGLLHFNVLGLFNFGLIMALVYLKTSSLFIPILLHALNNFAAVSFDVILSSLSNKASVDSLEQLQSYWWLGLIAIGLSVPWLTFFWWKNYPSSRQTLPYFANRGDYL